MSLRSPSPARTLSEGEVSSGDEEKAISTKHAHSRNSGVNTSTRLPSNGSSSRHSQARGGRDRSRSPYARDRDRSRSPYRANKPTSGEKRRREDDHYTKHGSDLRRFKVHYEDKDSRPRVRSGRDRDRSRSPCSIFRSITSSSSLISGESPLPSNWPAMACNAGLAVSRRKADTSGLS